MIQYHVNDIIVLRFLYSRLIQRTTAGNGRTTYDHTTWRAFSDI